MLDLYTVLRRLRVTEIRKIQFLMVFEVLEEVLLGEKNSRMPRRDSPMHCIPLLTILECFLHYNKTFP